MKFAHKAQFFSYAFQFLVDNYRENSSYAQSCQKAKMRENKTERGGEA